MTSRVVHPLHQFPLHVLDAIIAVLIPGGLRGGLILIIFLFNNTREDLQFTFRACSSDASWIGPHGRKHDTLRSAGRYKRNNGAQQESCFDFHKISLSFHLNLHLLQNELQQLWQAPCSSSQLK